MWNIKQYFEKEIIMLDLKKVSQNRKAVPKQPDVQPVLFRDDREEPPECFIDGFVTEIEDDVKIEQAKNLPKGWLWHQYSDGSGHLESPDGKSFFIYDQETGEYKETDKSEWTFWNEYWDAQQINNLKKFKTFAEHEVCNMCFEKICV